MLQNWKENIQNTSMYFEKVINDRHYTIKKMQYHLQCKKKHYVCMYIYMFVVFIYAVFTIRETVFCRLELADGSGLGK